MQDAYTEAEGREIEDSLQLLQTRIERIEALLVILIEDQPKHGPRSQVVLDQYVDSWKARHRG